jgi:sterol desaturase/sphingolipid hydroxylase (fatty acid hydroxylase superfamily)
MSVNGNLYQCLIWFAIAFLFASLVEYWMHRLMHISSKHKLKQKFPKIGVVHTEHHIRNTGQGVLGEFRDYVKGGLLVLFVMFLYSPVAGISWLVGLLSYAVFAAYAHQLQHDNPTKCFWMKMPVHYVHHKYNQWHHNFGIGVDWWDHLFGTYKEMEWLTEKELEEIDRGYLDIKWL